MEGEDNNVDDTRSLPGAVHLSDRWVEICSDILCVSVGEWFCCIPELLQYIFSRVGGVIDDSSLGIKREILVGWCVCAYRWVWE